MGLVSGACFAELGNEVAVVEVDAAKLASLQSGQIPIYEPGLQPLVAANAAAGRLTFGDDIAAAVAGVDAVFIAVGNPPPGAATAMPTSPTSSPPSSRSPSI